MVNKTNIDSSLLTIVENINENSANNLLNETSIKKGIIEKCAGTLCVAAVPYATKSSAYNDIQAGNIEVYLLKENIKGTCKVRAYSRCSKRQQDGCDYCHIHKKASENDKSSELKIFEKDILPQDSNDKSKYKAEITDEYFNSMGKRGAKKKNVSYNFIFSSDSNPILMILNHPNAKLTTSLEMFATQLLKTNTPISNITLTPLDQQSAIKSSEDINENESVKKTDKLSETSDKDSKDFKNIKTVINVNNVNNVNNVDNNNDKSSIIVDDNLMKEDIESDKEDIESDKEDIESDKEDIESDKDDDNISVASDASSSIECISIKTMKGKEIFLEPDTNNVYDTDGDDSSYALLGIFTNIDEKYATIKYDDEYYTVMKDYEKGKYCVFTNRVYNTDNKQIGILKKSKSGEIKFYSK